MHSRGVKLFGGIFLALFLPVMRLAAQELFFRSIGTDQGLPSSEAYQLLQDVNGYIWIATDGGVCRYDGSSVTVFTTRDGLSENVILGVYEDRKERIWFRTLSGEICYYDRGKITGIAANPELRELMKRCFTTSIFVGENDTLYCGTGGPNELLKIPPAANYGQIITERFNGSKQFIIENKTRKREMLAGLTADMDPAVKTTVYWEGKKIPLQFRDAFTLLDNACRVMKDRAGNTWLSCFKELVRISPGGQVQYYSFGSDILKVYEDRDGDLWLGLKRGGTLFYKGGDMQQTPMHFLPGLSVSDILQDREGSLWICTTEKGVFQSLSKNVFAVEIERGKVAGFCLSPDHLHIAIDQRRELVADTAGRLTYNERSVQRLPPSAELLQLAYTPGGFLYATSQGLFLTDDDGHTSELLVENRHSTYLRGILLAGHDSVFLSGYGNYTFLAGEKPSDPQVIPFIINASLYTRAKQIIIGTRGKDGLYIVRGNKYESFLPEPEELKTRINCLLEDDHGNLWIGTNEKGVYCYSGKQLFSFTEQSGLPSNKINALALDEQGRLWLATNKGLGRIRYGESIANATVDAFGKNNGLPGTETDRMIFFSGRIWCATKEQLFYFDPQRLEKNRVPPPVLIRSVMVNARSCTGETNPELRHDENNLSFVLNGMTYRRSNEKDFLYRLDGYDSQWQHSSTGNMQYTNLPPGNYTFISYAVNDSGVKSTTAATWKFTIRKPFWLTGWFIALLVLLVVAAGYGMAKWWVGRVRKREREKAKMSRMLSEFQLTALRAQMNPHFIFNAISSIQHYILQNDVQQSYNYLAKFSKLIRNVLDHSKEEELLLQNEIETLQLYVELEQLRFTLPFRFQLELDPALDPGSLYIPTMIIQPFVENAIWHGLTPKKEQGNLLLAFRLLPEALQVIVEDDGVGRHVSARRNRGHESRGMLIVTERIAVLNTKNNGNYRLTVTDLENGAGEACGTRIELILPVIHE